MAAILVDEGAILDQMGPPPGGKRGREAILGKQQAIPDEMEPLLEAGKPSWVSREARMDKMGAILAEGTHVELENGRHLG